MSRLTLIVAATKSNGIGQNGQLPWHLPKEMKYFAHVTSTAPEDHANAVIMGRNTWESIPQKFKPLKNRVNIVISRNKDYQLCVQASVRSYWFADGSARLPSGSTTPKSPLYLESDLSSALTRVSDPSNAIHRSFVIGGASLYSEVLSLPPSLVDRILLTRILSPSFEQCDVFMPDFLTGQTSNEGSGWQRASHVELQAWVAHQVPEGIQEENSIQYEFQMWVRQLR